MLSDYLEPACNGLSAVTAIAAGAAWLKAAKAPLPWFAWGGEGGADMAPAANLAEFQASYDANTGAARGAVWNRRAAFLASISAVAQGAGQLIALFMVAVKP